MSTRFVLPYADVGNGISPSNGAKLYFYATGTTTPKDTYSDVTLSIANSNPVVADSNGLFDDIFLSGSYKVLLKDKNGVQVWSADPVSSSDLTPDTVADMLATSYAAGTLVNTKGYTSAGDGGQGSYLWKTAAQVAADGDVIDEIGAGFTGVANPALFAVLQGLDKGVWITQFGAITSATNNSPAIQAAIDFAFRTTKGYRVLIPEGTFDFQTPLDWGEGIANQFGGYMEGVSRKQRQGGTVGGSRLMWTGNDEFAILARGTNTDDQRLPIVLNDLVIENAGTCDYGVGMQQNQRYTIWRNVEILFFDKAAVISGENWIIRLYNTDLRKGVMDGFATPDGVRHNPTGITGALVQQIDFIGTNIEQNGGYGMYWAANRLGVCNLIGGLVEGNAASASSTAAQIYMAPGQGNLNLYGNYAEWGNNNTRPFLEWALGGSGSGTVNLFGPHFVRKNADADFQTSGTGTNVLKVNLFGGSHFDFDGDNNLWVDPADAGTILLNDQRWESWAAIDAGSGVNFGPRIYNAYDGTATDRRAGFNVDFTDQARGERTPAGFAGFQRRNSWSSAAATNKDAEFLVEGLAEDVLVQLLLCSEGANRTSLYPSRLFLNQEDVLIQTGANTPEGAVTANPGSLYLRSNGGAGTTFYVKETGTGNTGWVAK